MSTLAQLQARLDELETIQKTANTFFEVSKGLNIAHNEDELLQVVALPALRHGACKAMLYYIDLNKQAEPEWVEVVASLDIKKPDSPDIPVGLQLHISEAPLIKLSTTQPNIPLFITNVATDDRFTQTERNLLLANQIHSSVIIPLIQASRWVGYIQFGWDTPHLFTASEAEFYEVLIGLAAPVAENQRFVQNLVHIVNKHTRKREEELVEERTRELQKQEAELDMFKTLVDNAPDGIYVNTLTGKITYANEAFRELSGYGNAIIGMNVTDLLPDDVLTEFGSARAQILEGQAWQGYMPHKQANGDIVPMQTSAFLIFDKAGHPRALASINHNITERIEAEKALIESEKKFYSLYVSMNEAIALYEMIYDDAERGVDYRFLDVNPTFEAMMNLDWADVINRRASDVYEVMRPPYLSTFNWVASSGEQTSFEAIDKQLGKTLRISVFSPRLGQFATILQDISQRKVIEQRMANYNRILEEEVAERTRTLSETLENLQTTQSQLVESEKMAALGSLVAGVAHEINTPVGIGVSMASLLAHETEKIVQQVRSGKMKISALKEYLQTATESSQLILNNLNRAAELVQSFKKVAVDQTSLDIREFAVKAYIHEILLNLRHEVKRTDHIIDLNETDHIIMKSYPGAFSQVISNLVMNSLKHAYEPGDTGHMQFTISQSQDDQVLIVYQDDGLGISPNNMSKIFDPFFTTARSTGGSGLGLHIVYNLVTQTLGGTIQCESEIGKGTTFTLNLPMVVEPKQPIASR